MRYGFLHTLFALAMVAGVAGCPGGDRGVGEPCGSHGDCDGSLQCSSGGVCVPRCARAPECGDGFACNGDGICVRSDGQPGDECTSEVDCSPGLSCQIDGNDTSEGHLLASCTAQGDSGKPAGSACTEDTEKDDCRNGTCALGQCVDLCAQTRDCAAGYACMEIPRVKASGALFRGCLPSSGNIVWNIPSSTISAPTATFLLPIPSAAHSATLVMAIDDPSQRVGVETLTSPSNQQLHKRPCEVEGPDCNPLAEYFANIVRHKPELAQSQIAIPSTPSVPLETGAYRVQVSSYRANGQAGSAVPHVTAVVRIDTATLLDLKFHFLDLEDHMCQSQLGPQTFDATQAQTAVFFQEDFVGELRQILSHGGIALGTLSYEDVKNRPDLDGLDVSRAGDLLTLGSMSTGVNVFFVRTLSPVGLQAFGPNPGPAGIAKTRQSGIVIGLDTLCFRSWSQLARLVAHELGRYMGLSHNVELDTDALGTAYQDKINDSDILESNLMFFSELGGTEISPGQRDILTRSPVLR